MVIKRDGLTKEIWFFLPASTTLNVGSFVVPNGLGQVIPALSTATSILGYYSGPSYSGATLSSVAVMVPITIPVENAVELTIDVEAGTITTAMVGSYIQLNDATGVNAAATSTNLATAYPIFITGVLSTTGGNNSLGQITGLISLSVF